MPTKLPESVFKAFLKFLATHGSVRRAARETGRETHVFYTRRRRDAKFAKRWERARERANAKIEDSLFELMDNPPDGMEAEVLRHKRWHLSRWMPERYGEKRELKINQSPVEIKVRFFDDDDSHE